MRESLGAILKPIAVVLHDVTAAIPMWGAEILVFIILGALIIYVALHEPIKPEHGDGVDLRWFALGVLVMQAVLYMVF